MLDTFLTILYCLFLLLMAGMLTLLIYSIRTVEKHQHWQHSFDGMQFSAEEFYQSVQAAIEAREVPNIRFSRVTYSEGAPIVGARREYLHIAKGRFVYDVCAAPYAKSFFVSMWHAEQTTILKQYLLRKYPTLQQITDKKTYYQIDTEGMAHGLIHAGFNEALEKLSASKGARGLSESERKFFTTQ